MILTELGSTIFLVFPTVVIEPLTLIEFRSNISVCKVLPLTINVPFVNGVPL